MTVGVNSKFATLDVGPNSRRKIGIDFKYASSVDIYLLMTKKDGV